MDCDYWGGVGSDVFMYSSITGTQTTIIASKRNVCCVLFMELSIVSYRSVIVIYKSQYYSLLSLYETMASFFKKKKEMPAELTPRCFQMFWQITVQTPLMSVLVMQHVPHNDELCRCLSPISIECAASSILFVAYKFHRLHLPPHFKFVLNYVDVMLSSSKVHCGPNFSRMSLLVW
jgi:hypothetical protein